MFKCKQHYIGMGIELWKVMFEAKLAKKAKDRWENKIKMPRRNGCRVWNGKIQRMKVTQIRPDFHTEAKTKKTFSQCVSLSSFSLNFWYYGFLKHIAFGTMVLGSGLQGLLTFGPSISSRFSLKKFIRRRQLAQLKSSVLLKR